MTREEAIKVLKDLWKYEHSELFSEKDIREALDMAIAALKQTEIDRIIAAIKAELEKQKELGINPSIRTFIAGEMAAIEIIEEMKKNDK